MSLKGGIITRRPLCYTPDGKAFFAPCGRDVRIYSAASGEHVGTLVGHAAAVTAVALDPASEANQVRRRAAGGSRRCRPPRAAPWAAMPLMLEGLATRRLPDSPKNGDSC